MKITIEVLGTPDPDTADSLSESIRSELLMHHVSAVYTVENDGLVTVENVSESLGQKP